MLSLQQGTLSVFLWTGERPLMADSVEKVGLPKTLEYGDTSRILASMRPRVMLLGGSPRRLNTCALAMSARK